MKKLLLLIFVLFIFALSASAQSTAFTFQGSLQNGGAPANGNYDFEFVVFDALTGGSAQATPITLTGVAVANGQFTVTLDFGSVFAGAPRYLETRVRVAGGGSFTPLAPRQFFASAPYASRALVAADAQTLGGIAANQYLTTSAASTGFLQNSTSPQTGNFNINGTGTANVFSATQFNSGGNRILKTGTFNVFLGVGAGTNTTADGGNTFVGAPAGTANTTGSFNSFFGSGAGENSIDGSYNSYFGFRAGRSGTSIRTTLLGSETFAGNGIVNSTAIGANALVGQNNSIVLGSINGVNGATADTSVGIGTTVPSARLSVVGGGFGANLFVADANTTATTFDLRNSSTGARTWRFQSMGSGDPTRVGNLELWNVGGNIALGITPSGNVGVGTASPFTKFQVNGNGLFQGDLAANNFSGNGSAIIVGPLGVGTLTPQQQLHIVGNGLLTGNLNVGGALNQFSNSGNANFFMKAQGAANGINFGVGANAGSNSTLYVSQFDGTAYQDRMIIDDVGTVSFTQKIVAGRATALLPTTRLEVAGFMSTGLDSNGTIAVCRTTTGILAFCSSSIRYKENVRDYTPGLDIVRRLRPVSFDWKSDKVADFGLIAEEAAAVEPLLATRNEKGEIEGVKYDRVGVVLVNAVMEQQSEIERQRETIKKQQAEIEALKAAVCALAPGAAVCTAPPVK